MTAMNTISERLRCRARSTEFSTVDPMCMEAADTIDALVEALERAKPYVDCAVHDDGGIDNCSVEYRTDLEAIDAALSLARKGGKTDD